MPHANYDDVATQLALDRRLQRAERWIMLNKFGWAALAVAGVLQIPLRSLPAAAAAPPQKLQLRELDIVDEHGRERIVIAAPIPDPIVNGKVAHRVRPVSASVQFKAADGTEQGGIAMSDDGSMIFGIDDERGRESRTWR